MTPMIGLLVVEPSDIIRQGLRAILGHDEGFNLLSSLHDADDLVNRVIRMQPDLLLINPTVVDSRQLAELRQARPSMALVALVYQYLEPQKLTHFHSVLDIREREGAIAQQLRDIMLSGNAAAEPSPDYELTDRESEVLVLVAKGLSSKEIADQLHLSVHTVNTHRKNLTRKTGIRSVAGLAVYAMLHNLY